MSSWARSLVAIVGIAIAVDALMVIGGMDPNLLLVAAVGIVAGVVLLFISELVNAPLDSAVVPIELADLPSARGDRRVMRLRSGLTYAQHDDVALERLRASLVDLVDDQLMAAHQIDRTEDPDAARKVIGDELYAFVEGTATARRLAQPRSLDHILTLIEQI